MRLDAPVTAIPKVGAKTAALYEKLDIRTVGDLLAHLPASYKDLRTPVAIRDAATGQEALVRAKVSAPPRWISRKGRFSVFRFEVADGTDVLYLSFFNLPFLFEKYKVGQEYYFYGKIKLFRGCRQMDNPAVYDVSSPPGMVANYPLTEGISQRQINAAMDYALAHAEIPEAFTGGFLAFSGAWSRENELRGAHRPKDPQEAQEARRSMILKELLVFCRMIELMDRGELCCEGLSLPEALPEEFEAKLPFSLTGAQRRVLGEIAEDLGKTRPMNRLVQGDVGSGKTVVAQFAAYAVERAGGQTLLMAPTELLAAQHFRSARALFGERVALLTGSTPAKERERIAGEMESGGISLLIGTHALLYAQLAYRSLRLVITDEQHRFGVAQRAALLAGNPAAHTLILSATPIPRTLALSLYGKVSVSVIDELPAGRIPVKTFLVGQNRRRDMYAWIRARLGEGEKAYVVCPLVEPSEGLNLCSAIELGEELGKFCSGIGVEVLHGKLPPAEKQRIMENFKSGRTRLLCSTTVVEVGVDVRDASMIAIENADRFGLAQLHQLRGRVGRGDRESFCYLVSDGSGLKRLEILKGCSDGFEIARRDLELRGSGQLLGQRQHGEQSLEVASLIRDADILEKAREVLENMPSRFEEDYQLITSQAVRKIGEGRAEVVLS